MAKLKMDKYKELLAEELELIKEELSFDSEAFNELGGQDDVGDLVDEAYKFYEKNLLIGISENQKKTLKAIQEALKRIQDGTYGTCEVCEKSIEEERLEAIPYTTMCIECAKINRKRW